MKHFLFKYSGLIMAMAFAFTTISSRRTCMYLLHQSPMPESAKRFRNF